MAADREHSSSVVGQTSRMEICSSEQKYDMERLKKQDLAPLWSLDRQDRRLMVDRLVFCCLG